MPSTGGRVQHERVVWQWKLVRQAAKKPQHTAFVWWYRAGGIFSHGPHTSLELCLVRGSGEGTHLLLTALHCLTGATMIILPQKHYICEDWQVSSFHGGGGEIAMLLLSPL
jgi:hypothetical protein